MGRITFLVGNGFDINVGLATSYREFYKFYIKECPKDLIAQDIIKNADRKFWSDMELGLGKYTGEVSLESKDLFLSSEENLECKLKEYLIRQCARIKIESLEKKMEVADEMKRTLCNFYQGLGEAERDDICRQIQEIDGSIIYSFISFNYTNVLDCCVDATKEIFSGKTGTLETNMGVYGHFLDNVLHIHGTTSTELVLGVNDDSQIVNKELCEDQLFRKLLVKKEAIQRRGQNIVKNAKQMIDQSQIICIFGMSIGETDRLWWQYICTWMRKDRTRRLVIFIKTPNDSRYQILRGEESVKCKLRNNSGMLEEVWNKIKKQIYVKCNPHIFDFELVE